MNQPEDLIAVLDDAQRRRGVGYIFLAIIIALLTAAVYIAVRDADDAKDAAARQEEAALTRDLRIQSLEQALDAQRKQFEVCKDERSTTPGCEKPVTPPPEDLSPEIIEGPAGAIGAMGPRGFSCIEELGYQKCRGSKGDKGDKGDMGSQGDKGDPGIGIQGDKGDKGDPGVDGKDGQDGRGVKSTFCGDDGRWDITYTDGSVEDGGVCRTDPGNSGGGNPVTTP